MHLLRDRTGGPPLFDRLGWVAALALVASTLACRPDAGQADTAAGPGTDAAPDGGFDDTGGDTTGASPSGQDSTGSGDDDTTGPGGYSCDREQAWFVEFAEDHCGRCHGPDGTGKGGFDYLLEFDTLVTAGKVVPGDPEASPLWLKMQSGAMPPQGELPRPDEGQIDRTAEFIRRCFPGEGAGFDDCMDMQYIGYPAQLALMLDDLTNLPAGDYPFIRYLTFTHLHDVGVCGSDFETYRNGLSKLVNSLSTQSEIVVPVPIDPSRSIYRIDMRDYGWDRPTGAFADAWEAAVASSEYAVVRFEDDAITLQQLTQTQIPFLMADAFIEVASQPPLYPLMAALPDDLSGLEAELGLDIADDVADQIGVARAGVLVSGVALRNRVLQRHAIANGAFWRTFEFDDDANPQQNILSSPLDFDEEGGSIIFSLPNGLHGYMVIDASGTRIDEAPTTLMLDPGSIGGRVRTGLSCFACHRDVVTATDDVRDFVLSGADFNATDKAIVGALYPPADDFHALQTQDNEDYHAALVDAGINPGAIDEPINASVDGFEDGPVSLQQAAAELGIAVEVLQMKLPALNPALEALRDGGTLNRNTWDGLFAETICDLNLGQPLLDPCG